RDLLLKLHGDPSLTADDKFHLRVNHAVCQWRLGNLDKAIDSMRQALSHAKTGLALNVGCSMLIEKARETGDFEEAAKMCRESLDYDEDDIAAICNAGWMHLWMYEMDGDRQQRDDAQRYFKRANAKNPNHPAALAGLSLIEKADGNMEAARAHIDRALEARFPATCIVSRAYAERISSELGA
ncbi:MAG: tetratricopeptide repeat protein, partial [Christensenellales bacterium]